VPLRGSRVSIARNGRCLGAKLTFNGAYVTEWRAARITEVRTNGRTQNLKERFLWFLCPTSHPGDITVRNVFKTLTVLAAVIVSVPVMLSCYDDQIFDLVNSRLGVSRLCLVAVALAGLHVLAWRDAYRRVGC
jgi:hypothetical protein